MFTQRDPQWASISMGNGTGSIGEYGCYLVSLCNGLLDFGYSFTPATLNQHFKDKNAWTGPYNNYIDTPNIVSKDPDIFTSFQLVSNWNDMAQLAGFLSNNYIVIGRVNATAIGGTGSHFVRVISINGADAIIQDPWVGNQVPVAQTYGKFGDILDLQVFGVKKAVVLSSGDPLLFTQAQYDEVRLARDKNYNDGQEYLVKLNEANKELEIVNKQLSTEKDAHQGDVEAIAKILLVPADLAKIIPAINTCLGYQDQALQANKLLADEQSKNAATLKALNDQISALQTQHDQLGSQVDQTIATHDTIQSGIDALQTQIDAAIQTPVVKPAPVTKNFTLSLWLTKLINSFKRNA